MWFIIYCRQNALSARHTDLMLVQCWTSVCDAGPTLNQHWVSVSCLLGGWCIWLCTCLQIVRDRLFTGSHDATLRVWDISGIKEDTTFGGGRDDDRRNEDDKWNNQDQDKQDGTDSGRHTRITIDEDMQQNNGGHMNGNVQYGVHLDS